MLISKFSEWADSRVITSATCCLKGESDNLYPHSQHIHRIHEFLNSQYPRFFWNLCGKLATRNQVQFPQDRSCEFRFCSKRIFNKSIDLTVFICFFSRNACVQFSLRWQSKPTMHVNSIRYYSMFSPAFVIMTFTSHHPVVLVFPWLLLCLI